MKLGIFVNIFFNRGWFERQPAMRENRVPLHGWPLHAVAVYLGILSFGVSAVALVASQVLAPGWLPHMNPMFLCCMFMILLNIGIGYFNFQCPRSYFIIAASTLYLVWANNSHDKIRLPNLNYDSNHEAEIKFDLNSVPPVTGFNSNPSPVNDLIEDEQVLKSICKRWQDSHRNEPASKPGIILIATSGGGIRAAVWTAVVLEGLEQAFPGKAGTDSIRDHIRLFTGSSGGMVAAGHYVADFNSGPLRQAPLESGASHTSLREFSNIMAQDSLSPTLQTMVVHDLPFSLWPFPVTRDRGLMLEESWSYHSQKMIGRKPLQSSMSSLRATESTGASPSLIFSPFMVEDARRLLISNLNVRKLGESDGFHLGTTTRESKRIHLSNSAVQFFDLFPNAMCFQVGTSARMSASFPLVSPAVYLPTVPKRRVVDAGFGDIYGVQLAGMWIFHNRELLKKYASGVLLIQIRAYRSKHARLNASSFDPKQFIRIENAGWNWDRDPTTFDADKMRIAKQPLEDKPTSKEGILASMRPAISFLSSPIEGLDTARIRTNEYRNDETLQFIDTLLNSGARNDFFATQEFETDEKTALSWKLSTDEIRHLVGGFYENDKRDRPHLWIQMRLAEIAKWFGKDGS